MLVYTYGRGGWLPPAKPPVDQVSDCQAVMVPSFVPAILILPKALGRLPAICCSVARSRKILTGFPPAFWGSRGAGPTGDELGGRPGHSLVALPLDHAAVGFQAAVGDHRDAVYAVGDGLGILHSFFGIAGDFFAGGLAARTGLGEVGFVDEVRHHFVLDLDLADGFAGHFLGGGGYGGHFLAVPLEFLAGLGDDEDGLDAVHLLRRAGIDRGDAGVAVRAGEVHREQHVLHLEVRGVLGAPRGFLRAVQALEGLTDDLAGFHRRPVVVGCVSHFSLPSYSWRLRGRPGGRPCKCRSGRGCRRARSSRRPWWGWGVRRGSPWWP